MEDLHYARWTSDLANGYYGPLVDFKIDFSKMDDDYEDIDNWWQENVTFKKDPKHLFQPPKKYIPPEPTQEEMEKLRENMYKPIVNDSIGQYITLDSGVVVMTDPNTGQIGEPIVFDDDDEEWDSITLPLLKALDNQCTEKNPEHPLEQSSSPVESTPLTKSPPTPPPMPQLPPKKRFVKKEARDKVVGNLVDKIKSHVLYHYSKIKILLNFITSHNVKSISSIKPNTKESTSVCKFTNDKNEVGEFTYSNEDATLFRILRLLAIPRLSLEELKYLRDEGTFQQIEELIKKDYNNNSLLVFHLKTMSEILDSKYKDPILMDKFTTYWKRDLNDIKILRQIYPTMLIWDIHDFIKKYDPESHSIDINGFNILTLSKIKDQDKNNREFNYYSGIYQPFINYFLLLHRPQLFFNTKKEKRNHLFDRVFDLPSQKDTYYHLYTSTTWNLNLQFECGFKYLFDEFVCSRLNLTPTRKEIVSGRTFKEIELITQKLESAYKYENHRMIRISEIHDQNVSLKMFPTYFTKKLLGVHRNLMALGVEVPPTINSQVNNYLKVSREILRSRNTYIKKKISSMRNIKKSIENEDYYYPYLLPIYYFAEITNKFKVALSYKITVFYNVINFFIYSDSEMKKLVKYYKMPADLKEVLQSMLILYNHKLYYKDYNCLKISDEISNPIDVILYFLKCSCPFQINTESTTLN